MHLWASALSDLSTDDICSSTKLIRSRDANTFCTPLLSQHICSALAALTIADTGRCCGTATVLTYSSKNSTTRIHAWATACCPWSWEASRSGSAAAAHALRTRHTRNVVMSH